MTNVIEKVTTWFTKQEKIKRTVRELSLLNDKELSDIGISRCDIYQVALGNTRRTI